MKLRFSQTRIKELASQYEYGLDARGSRLTQAITQEVFPSYRSNGYPTKDQFLTVCAWKTPRSKSRCESNDEEMIQEISTIVLTTGSERLRIQAWTLLSGVKWPTASVFLHFAIDNEYPILDFLALWSLKTEVPAQYSFPFWWEYTCFRRELARKAGVTMRTLDQSLWQYSKRYQRT